MKSILLILFSLICLNFFSQNLSKEDSLILQKYYNAGVPSLNRDWSPNDYTTAVEVILAGNKNKTLKLPDHKNASGKIFEKIVDYNKYWFFESDKFSIMEKLSFQGQMAVTLGHFITTYGDAGVNANAKLKHSYELSKLMITSLMLMDRLIVSVEDMRDEGPALTDEQKEGVKDIKAGAAEFSAGLLELIEKEPQTFEPKELCEMVNVFFGFYNKHRGFLDSASRTEFDLRKTKLVKAGKLECIRSSAASVEPMKK